MKRIFIMIPLVILLVFPLVLTSCGDDDDKGGGTEPVTTDLPDIPQPEVNQSVDFQSQDQTAVQAQTLVQAQLFMASGIATMGAGFLAPVAGADWGSSTNDCWTWTYTYGGCTWTYAVCETTEGYEWTMTFNGTCFDPEDEPAVNWVALRGFMNTDGTEGHFYWYEVNTTDVGGAWEWESNAEGRHCTWTFYEGEIDPANEWATFTWTKNADDSEDMTWVMEDSKFVSHVSADGNSGWMEYYTKNTGDWTLYWKIVWNADGSGSWTTYDESGPSTQTWDSGS
ncbi:MAG: hypothetical protein KAY24_16385 [Candidatus Eisenbacteria sp.]|nr:hypothetical protein [Candidatus Eisenbacteria bacterium]